VEPPSVAVHAMIEPPPVPAALAPFEFLERPFTLPPPGKEPFRLPPFLGALEKLTRLVQEEPGPVAFLTGAEGSGRTHLCRMLVAEQSRRRLVVHLDVQRDLGDRTLLQRLSRATGAVEESAPTADEQLEGLLARLDEERHQWGQPPLLILSGVAAGQTSQLQLGNLVAAALWSRGFKVLLVGATGVAEALSLAGIPPRHERLPEVQLPSLDRAQTAAYVHRWVRLTRAPDARALLLTPDALLLVHHRSRGVIARVDCIAENMLLLAAQNGARVVNSWHAWLASDTERWVDGRRPSSLPPRPAVWPTADAARAIDLCRREAGLRPRPRNNSGPLPPVPG
jgi:type II secretory pathway predicted ATPase ExeA